MRLTKLLNAFADNDGPPIEESTSVRIDTTFREEDRELVRELIVDHLNWRMPGWRNATLPDFERIRFAVLKLAAGDVQRLRQAIELAKVDFRDVLVAAEFTDVDAHTHWMPESNVD